MTCFRCLLLACLTVLPGNWALAQQKEAPKKDRLGDPLPAGALDRLGTARWRHGGPVSFAAVLPGGKEVLSVGDDGRARVWEILSGKLVRDIDLTAGDTTPPVQVRGIPQGVSRLMVSASVSSDGKTLTAAMTDRYVGGFRQGEKFRVRLWNLADGKERKAIEGLTFQPSSVAFSPDGKTLAVRGNSGEVEIREVATGKQVHQLVGTDNSGMRFFGRFGTSDLAFSPDGKKLLSVSMEMTDQARSMSLKVWDTAKGKQLHEIKPEAQNGRIGYVYGCAWSPDSKMVAWIGMQGEVSLFDLSAGKEKSKFKLDFPRAGLLFTPDGKHLITDDELNGRTSLWDVATGKKARDLETTGRPATRNVYSVLGQSMPTLSPDGKVLARGRGNSVQLLELATGKNLVGQAGNTGPVNMVSWSSDGKTLLTQCGELARWELATGKRSAVKLPTGQFYGLNVSADGRFVVGISPAGLQVTDLTTGKEVKTINRDQDFFPSQCLLSPDGKVLACADQRGLGVRLFSTESGKEARTLNLGDAPQNNNRLVFEGQPASPVLAFSHDSRLFFNVHKKNGVVWNAQDGRQLWTVPLDEPEKVRHAVFARDGRSVAVDHGDFVTVIELASGRQRKMLGEKPARKPKPEQQGSVYYGGIGQPVPATMALSDDGRTLALAAKNDVRVWDVIRGKEIGKLAGHTGEVESLAFSSDGKRLASGSADSTVLIWDVAALASKEKTAEVALKDDKLAALWKDLSGSDAEASFAALSTLLGSPKDAAAYLDKKVAVAEVANADRVKQLIADLDARRFATRKKAQDELEKMGPQALLAIKAALAGQVPAEARKYLETLADRYTGNAPTGDQLVSIRAVEVLEKLGTPEAKKVLTKLAAGAKGATVTDEASAALTRLK